SHEGPSPQRTSPFSSGSLLLDAFGDDPATWRGIAMAKSRGEFTDLLLKQQVLSPEQVEEAKGLQAQAGMKLHDALVKLGYLTQDQVIKAIAEFNGMAFVELTDLTIPALVVEQVPESVARENVIMPLSLENGTMKVVISDPTDFETVEK